MARAWRQTPKPWTNRRQFLYRRHVTARSRDRDGSSTRPPQLGPQLSRQRNCYVDN